MPTPTSSSLSNHPVGEKSKSCSKLYSNVHDGKALNDITGRANALSRSAEDITTKSKGAKLVSRSHSVSSKYYNTNPKVEGKSDNTKLWEASSIRVHKMRSPSSNSDRVAWKQVGSGANINVWTTPTIRKPKQATQQYSAKPCPLPQSKLHEYRHISSDPSILSTIKYWLAQIKLSEAAQKHMISIGFFRLAFECKAEPFDVLQGELVAYINRHSLCSEEINKLLLCYGIEGQYLRKECLKALKENVDHCELNSLQATSVELETLQATTKLVEEKEKEMERMGGSIFHRAFIKQLPSPVSQSQDLQESETGKVTKPPFKTTHINLGLSYCDLRDKPDGDNSKRDIMNEGSMEAGSLFQESTQDKTTLGSDRAGYSTMDVNALMKEVVSHIMSSMDESYPTDGKDLEDNLSAALVNGRRCTHANKPEQQMPELMGNLNNCKVQETMATYGCDGAIDSMQFISSADTLASVTTMDVNTLMKEVVSHIILSMGEESKEALVCSILGGIERPLSSENTAVLNDLSEVLIHQGKEAQSNKKTGNITSSYTSGGDSEEATISPKEGIQSHDILTMVSDLKGNDGLADISVKGTTDLVNFDGSPCDQSNMKAGNITSLYANGGGGLKEATISLKDDMQSYDILTSVSDLKGDDGLAAISVKGTDSIGFDGSPSEQARTPTGTRIERRQKTPFKPKIASILDSQNKECCLATLGNASDGSTKTNRLLRQSLNQQSSHSIQHNWNIGSTRNKAPAATVNESRCKSQDKPTKQKLIISGDFKHSEAQESMTTPGSCGLRRSTRLLSVGSISTPVSELGR